MSGSLAHSPAMILRQALVDLALGTAPADAGNWPVYVSQEPDSPDSVITVYDTAGVKDGRDQVSGRVYEHYGAQVRVRDANHAEGYAKAQTVAVALDESLRLRVVTVSGSRYVVYGVTRTGTVLSLGKDVATSKRNLFTFNVLVALRAL